MDAELVRSYSFQGLQLRADSTDIMLDRIAAHLTTLHRNATLCRYRAALRALRAELRLT